MLRMERNIDISLTYASYEEEKKIGRKVERIIDDVFYTRDRALVKYTRKYDCPSFDRGDIELKKSRISLSPEISGAIQEAASRIRNFALAQKKALTSEIRAQSCVQISLPIEKVGVYIPGKKASLFSTVLMTVIPAKVAGVKEVYLVSPPNEMKEISPLIQYTASLAGVERVFRVGGVQAIAALAFGTETIPRVSKIVGPGNSYVQMAKNILSRFVGIDTLAGPSEIVVVADKTAEPDFVALDLLAQAEHGADSKALLITDSKLIARKVRSLLLNRVKDMPRKNIISKALKQNGKIILVDDIKEAFPIVNTLSPEHVSLQLKNPERHLSRIKNAGAIFVGSYSPPAAGDYWAGPSHVLPTNGAARFSSHLGVRDFLKELAAVCFSRNEILDDIEKISLLAEEEELMAHSRSLQARKK